MTTGIESAPSWRFVSLRELRGDLVERGEDEPVELDLADRAEAAHREPDRGADDARLGERRVEHALVAELGLEALGDAEDAAERADVLAHEQHLLVGAQRARSPALIAFAIDSVCTPRRSGRGASPRSRAESAAVARRGIRHLALLVGASVMMRLPRSEASYSASHARCSSMSGCGSL